MRIFVSLFFCSLFFLVFCTVVHAAEGRFWDIQSIDTMKYSRDIAREPNVIDKVPALVSNIAALTPTHIAISTPYDEEFYPYLKKWVDEARSHHLKIWFRGNWSSWEGWFGYPKFTNITEHHTKTAGLIAQHPELFADGDIFTPAPEAENGVIGDPRFTPNGKNTFNQFLVASYDTCTQAFEKINKDVKCGYFSTNGDVAREILTPEVVSKIGGVVVIDHYVKDTSKLIADIQFFNEKYKAPIVLGEFGAPIPDIHGEFSQKEQADYIENAFYELTKINNIVQGINYWTAYGGSTRLFEGDLAPRTAATVVGNYYGAQILEGQTRTIVKNDPSNISVGTGKFSATTDTQGRFQLLLPKGPHEIVFSKPGYSSQTKTIDGFERPTKLNVVLYSEALTQNPIFKFFKKFF